MFFVFYVCRGGRVSIFNDGGRDGLLGVKPVKAEGRRMAR